MRKLRSGRRGQALILVTLALFAMCGLLGLAVDLGYSYWMKKAAQTAADSAALAAANQALAQVGEGAAFTSSNSTVQGSPAPCDLGGNLHNGCQYASLGVSYGFTHSGNNGHQDITMESGVNSSPNDCKLPAPTAPCLPGEPPGYPKPTGFDYWVTVRTVESIPQLFSVLLGNTTGMSSARATAAIMPVIANGSLWTLNRANDGFGSNVTLKGHDTITAPQGVIVANNATDGISTNGATEIIGPISQLSNPKTQLTAPGACNPSNPCMYQASSDGPQYYDPMRGLGQPPLPSAKLPVFAVLGGDLGSSPIYKVGVDGVADISVNYHGTTLPSGNYIFANWGNGCGPGSCHSVVAAPGSQLGVGGAAVTFGDSSGFGAFFFYGGLNVSGNMTMGPGEYVIVGSSGSDALNIGKGANVTNNGAAGAGEMFIDTGTGSNFTFDNNSNPTAVVGNANNDLYPGLTNQINSNPLLVKLAASNSGGQPVLGFGDFLQQTGLGNIDTLDPSGLNPGASGFPAQGTLVNPVGSDISKFAGVVFWQDQANTTIRYTANGNIDLSCGGINSPCTNSLLNSNSPEWHLQAQGSSGMTGIIYQPRGAWILLKGHGVGTGITGPIQIITGSVQSNGGGVIDLNTPPIPLTTRIVALIE